MSDEEGEEMNKHDDLYGDTSATVVCLHFSWLH
jgi:hypothetical protein